MSGKTKAKGKSKTTTTAPARDPAVLAFGLTKDRNGMDAAPAGLRSAVVVDLDYLLRERNHVLAEAQRVQVERDQRATAKPPA